MTCEREEKCIQCLVGQPEGTGIKLKLSLKN